jgi:hypothetical protein
MGGTYLDAFQNYIEGSAGHVQSSREQNSLMMWSVANVDVIPFNRLEPQVLDEAAPRHYLSQADIASQLYTKYGGPAGYDAHLRASTNEWLDSGRRIRETHNFTRPDPNPRDYGYIRPSGGG